MFLILNKWSYKHPWIYFKKIIIVIYLKKLNLPGENLYPLPNSNWSLPGQNVKTEENSKSEICLSKSI